MYLHSLVHKVFVTKLNLLLSEIPVYIYNYYYYATLTVYRQKLQCQTVLYRRKLRGTTGAPATLTHKFDKSHVRVVSLAPLRSKTEPH